MKGQTYLLLDYISGTDLRQIIFQKGKQDGQSSLSESGAERQERYN